MEPSAIGGTFYEAIKNRARFGKGGGSFRNAEARMGGTRDTTRGMLGFRGAKISNVDEGARVAQFLAKKGTGPAALQAEMLTEARNLTKTGDIGEGGARLQQIAGELGLDNSDVKSAEAAINKVFDDLAKSAKTGGEVVSRDFWKL